MMIRWLMSVLVVGLASSAPGVDDRKAPQDRSEVPAADKAPSAVASAPAANKAVRDSAVAAECGAKTAAPASSASGCILTEHSHPVGMSACTRVRTAALSADAQGNTGSDPDQVAKPPSGKVEPPAPSAHPRQSTPPPAAPPPTVPPPAERVGQTSDWDRAPGGGLGIVGSKHDFSRFGWSGNELCLPCHTPHSTGAPGMGPLWDRSEEAQSRYRLYGGTKGTPGPATLICLSCHDGGTAMDAYGGMTGGVFIQDFGSRRSQIGKGGDLRSDHPVGVRYPEFDRGFRPRVQVEGEGTVMLPDGKVECLSCHDVHNQYGVENLLVKSNRRSALCLTCHRK